MKIILDGAAIDIFSGALVKDVLLKSSQETYNAVLTHNLQVLDQWGNAVGMDGQLEENQELYLQNIPNVPDTPKTPAKD